MKTSLLIRISVFITVYLFPYVSVSDVNTSTDEKKTLAVTQLSYVEGEPGVDDYAVTMIISDRYIRVDEVEEDSGYIIYDDKEKTIYSVSHDDESVLIIKKYDFSSHASPVKSITEYSTLSDAPKIAGKTIFNYRVSIKKNVSASNQSATLTCMDIQLAEGFLPGVSKLLQNYQKVISGQQVKMVDNKITEMQPPCFYVDQVYNEGSYYEKGLPIQEWHSNDRYKALTSYKKIEVESSIFLIPEGYRQFSMDNNSKRFLE